MINFILLQLSQTGYFYLLGGLFFFPLIVAVITVKDIFYNEALTDGYKLAWIGIVVLIPLVGAIAYYFLGKARK